MDRGYRQLQCGHEVLGVFILDTGFALLSNPFQLIVGLLSRLGKVAADQAPLGRRRRKIWHAQNGRGRVDTESLISVAGTSVSRKMW